MPINRNEISKEMVTIALQCETAEEMIVLAKADGYDITKEEAEAYMAQMDDQELDSEQLKLVAGGGEYVRCLADCGDKIVI